jgi:uncharacterized protein YheU (UPF0270 family)
MIIPLEQIPDETLTAIIEDFILREGTDYGDIATSKEAKIAQVKEQLKRGDAVLVYSELHESVNILPKDQFLQQQSESTQEQ